MEKPSDRVLPQPCDVLLVGSGTMAAMLEELEPRLTIRVVEITPDLAHEADGSVNIFPTLKIFERFEHSRQFSAYAVAHGMAGEPAEFIHAVPHICFVQGEADVPLLDARQAALREHHFFHRMEFTVDPATIHAWAPLVMEGRGPARFAATRAAGGSTTRDGSP